jgi:cyclopropane fatty-acyl-phospholipid synthase-like methyltransferase
MHDEELFGPRYLLDFEGRISHAVTLRQIEFLEREIPLRQGMRILDIPCGHGRHAVEFAIRVTTFSASISTISFSVSPGRGLRRNTSGSTFGTRT